MSTYYWWHIEDLWRLGLNILRYSVTRGPWRLKVEFHPDEEYEGSRGVIKLVDSGTGAVLGTYNYTHTCPPECN